MCSIREPSSLFADLILVRCERIVKQGGELVKHDFRVKSEVRVPLDHVTFDDTVADVKK